MFYLSHFPYVIERDAFRLINLWEVLTDISCYNAQVIDTNIICQNSRMIENQLRTDTLIVRGLNWLKYTWLRFKNVNHCILGLTGL